MEWMLLYSYWIPIQATLPSTLVQTSNPSGCQQRQHHELTIQVKDDSTGEIKGSQYIYVVVQDIAEAPVISSNGGGESAEISIDENSIISVSTVSATDPDGDTVSFSLTGGADQNLFSLEATSGVLSFKVAPDFENPDDSDNDNKYVIQITATDDSRTPLPIARRSQYLFLILTNLLLYDHIHFSCGGRYSSCHYTWY